MISIIIPTYNSASYIYTVLGSILSQSYREVEILILDNLSTDSTLDILAKEYTNDNRIKVFSGKDNGIYDAMNKGIQLATGEWVYFMGSDDSFYDTQVLENVAKQLADSNDLVYGDVMWVPDNVKEEGEWTYSIFLRRNINHQRIFYKRALFEKYGAYDIGYKVAADHELNIRFFCNDAIIKKHIPVVIASYHAGGFSANRVDEKFWNNWKEIVLKNFLPHLPIKEIYSSLSWYCWYNIDQRKNAKAFRLALAVFFHTFSPGFVKLTLNRFLKTNRKNAT